MALHWKAFQNFFNNRGGRSLSFTSRSRIEMVSELIPNILVLSALNRSRRGIFLSLHFLVLPLSFCQLKIHSPISPKSLQLEFSGEVGILSSLGLYRPQKFFEQGNTCVDLIWSQWNFGTPLKVRGHKMWVFAKNYGE